MADGSFVVVVSTAGGSVAFVAATSACVVDAKIQLINRCMHSFISGNQAHVTLSVKKTKKYNTIAQQ